MNNRFKRQTLGFGQKIWTCTHTCAYLLGMEKSDPINLDLNVYLKSFDCNLQRPLVWTVEQKQELIISMLIGKPIGTVAINIVNTDDLPLVEVIDGKQRTATMYEWLAGNLTIDFNGETLKWSDLTEDEQDVFLRYEITIQKYCLKTPLTEKEKIDWFLFLNNKGVPVNKAHLQKIEKLV